MAVVTGLHDFSGATPFRPVVAVMVLALILVPLYLIGQIIYNLYFHPLAKYPGPKSMAATRIPYLLMLLSGDAPGVVTRYHEKYGSVFRIAPDELSFITDGEAWKSIYGTRPGHSQKSKDYRFYNPTVGGAPSIIVSNDTDHTRFRRLLSHAFSDNSLRGQEPIIQGYINLFIQRLHEISEKGTKPIDLVSWYNFTTFDIIGDLAFGESFNCLKNSNYHPWVSIIFKNIKAGAYVSVARRVPGGDFLKRTLTPKSLLRAKAINDKLTMEKVDARVKQTNNDRPDFFGNILKYNGTSKGFAHRELYSNGSTLIIAGSETTATLLAGATYLLMRNPEKLAKLKAEVRSAFKNESEINLDSCNQLHYTQAVLTETLRVYPPVPVGLPRIVDAQGDTIGGNFVPGGTVVSISHAATYKSESNFKYAKQFIPERHLDDPEFANDNKEALQPFSFGPRNCIGRNLAYVEMRLILSRLIFNFDLELAEPEFDWIDQKSYTLWEKMPLMAKLIPRDMTQSA
ncbi:hypothetical protein N7493_009125 [Penicillium malachiteum]|uniref:Cytochrome P450 n=1 Tax=Penicillium malachiteum TaxID=1324776 RepID=A0AAD6HFW5_9EURO|nr:hypothetical protein N7493_009125 [Penicillium malachiteum]